MAKATHVDASQEQWGRDALDALARAGAEAEARALAAGRNPVVSSAPVEIKPPDEMVIEPAASTPAGPARAAE